MRQSRGSSALAVAVAGLLMVALGIEAATGHSGNGQVTVTVSRRTFEIKVEDLDGIRNLQLTAKLTPANAPAGTVLELYDNNNCKPKRVIPLALSKHRHAHRVLWLDCQKPERYEIAGPAVELWEVPAPTTPPPTSPELISAQFSERPFIVDVVPPHITKFHAVIVGTSNGEAPLKCAEAVQDLTDALKTWPGWEGLGPPIVEPAATRAAIETAVNQAKTTAQPGDEFLFHFCGHGGPKADATGEEPFDNQDELIALDDDGNADTEDTLTDEDLKTLLSGFKRSVTITVVIDACCAGGFVDGTGDLLNMTDDTGQILDKDHLAILMAVRTSFSATNAKFTQAIVGCLKKAETMPRADENKDGITTSVELFNCAREEVRKVPQTPVFASGVGP